MAQFYGVDSDASDGGGKILHAEGHLSVVLISFSSFYSSKQTMKVT